MENIEKLNKTFEQKQILQAEELNEITGKIDEIIDAENPLINNIEVFNDGSSNVVRIGNNKGLRTVNIGSNYVNMSVVENFVLGWAEDTVDVSHNTVKIGGERIEIGANHNNGTIQIGTNLTFRDKSIYDAEGRDVLAIGTGGGGSCKGISFDVGTEYGVHVGQDDEGGYNVFVGNANYEVHINGYNIGIGTGTASQIQIQIGSNLTFRDASIYDSYGNDVLAGGSGNTIKGIHNGDNSVVIGREDGSSMDVLIDTMSDSACKVEIYGHYINIGDGDFSNVGIGGSSITIGTVGNVAIGCWGTPYGYDTHRVVINDDLMIGTYYFKELVDKIYSMGSN